VTLIQKYLDSFERPFEEKDTSTPDGKLADKTIKYCPECRRCYDTRYYKDVGNTDNIIYYHDFPSFGKEKRICKECK
jgi:hypothetical protein